MKERKVLEERKKEERSEKLKDINNKRREELLKNKIKDSPKNKERKRNNFNIMDFFDLILNITINIKYFILFLEVIL
jgi:hypothetical protein